jgi:beta-glucosidase
MTATDSPFAGAPVTPGRAVTGRLRQRWSGMLLYVALSSASPGCAAAVAGGVLHPDSWPAARPAIAAPPQLEAFVGDLLARMTLEEKIGQLIQADIASITPADLQTYRLGSILAGGNAAPGGNLRGPAQNWLDLTDAFFRAAVATTSGAHAPIPLLFGIDAVHGHARIPGATIFPHNVGLGAAHDPALVEQVGHATAEEVAATGIDWTFAPTVAVVRDVRWGRSYESYSEDPALVAEYARSMVIGLQGHPGSADFLTPGHTLASVKHFLGDGGTVDGRDQFDNRTDERTLREVHGAGYPSAIEAGALIVMASYNGWHGAKLHANRPLLTDVLKGRWAFPGFVVGDWNAQEEIPGCTKYDCPAVLNAGLDLYMAPDSWKRLYVNLLAQARAGLITGARIDDAVRRVLRVKALAGLFGRPAPKDRADARPAEQIGSAAHRAIARQAVRESLVLLKNNRRVLPLDPHSTILVAGPGADDIGMQSGGWTIDWQGDHNTNADFPGATSILGGIRAAVAAAGGRVITSLDAATATHPSAAVVVYGELPYSEFEGDRETLEFAPADGAPLKLLRQLRAAGIPVVSVFLSGRPLWVNRELNASDAFVAAWLPGSEGAGVADLLLQAPAGTPIRDFTGRLSFSWPATAMPVRFDAGGRVHGALFARGSGLTLASRRTVARLPEDPVVPAGLQAKDTLFHSGHVTAPWSVYVADDTAEVRLTMQSQWSPERAVSARLAQSTVQAAWSGNGSGDFWIGGRAADLRSRAQDGTAIVLRYRVDESPTAPVAIGIRCEAPYGSAPPAAGEMPVPWKNCGTRTGALLDVTAAFRKAATGSWQTLAIPLACIAAAGATLDLVNAPFAIETRGRFKVSIVDVRFVPHSAAVCPAPAAGRGN